MNIHNLFLRVAARTQYMQQLDIMTRFGKIREVHGETSDTRKLVEIIHRIKFLMKEASPARNLRSCYWIFIFIHQKKGPVKTRPTVPVDTALVIMDPRSVA